MSGRRTFFPLRAAALFAALSVFMPVWADPPAGVMEVFRNLVDSLAEQDTAAFLDSFDSKTPGLTGLRANVDGLIAAEGAASTIDVVSDAGDDQRRDLQVDWLLRVGSHRPRRAVLRFTLEHRGKQWQIVGLEPADFFRPFER